jgi:phosphomannomutase
MNEVVLTQTALGVADFVREGGAAQKVVVAYDTRRDSRHFAHHVGAVLASQGLAVRLFDAPRPTPQLGFEVRQWGAGAGIVISASHNPPSDNGIKIYGADGAQVLGDNDRRLMEAITAIGSSRLTQLELGDAAALDRLAPGAGLDARDAAYAAYIASQGVWPHALGSNGLRVVYTPLHGVGHHIFAPLLRAREAALYLVEAQLDPDGGRFSTVVSANPESPAAFDLARQLADEVGADLVVAHDPDADRLGALTRDAQGSLQFVDGNRLGALLLDHLLCHVERPRGVVLSTLVTSPLIAKMARAGGLTVVDDLLVGFKHHAGIVEECPDQPVFFACEESHGYVRGNDIRDKDGAIGGLLLVEAAAAAAARGEPLLARLDAVWKAHGYHAERTISVWARGAAGREAIAAVMAKLRADAPSSLGGLTLAARVDRLVPLETASETRNLPGNVLVLEYSKGTRACRVVLRPSGTEPKLKVYALASGAPGDNSSVLRDGIDATIAAVLADAQALVEGIVRPFLAAGGTRGGD